MGILRLTWSFLRVMFASQAALAAENLALRHQLAVLQRSVPRPKLRTWDRAYWLCADHGCQTHGQARKGADLRPG
jgi:hypothetical protein